MVVSLFYLKYTQCLPWTKIIYNLSNTALRQRKVVTASGNRTQSFAGFYTAALPIKLSNHSGIWSNVKQVVGNVLIMLRMWTSTFPQNNTVQILIEYRNGYSCHTSCVDYQRLCSLLQVCVWDACVSSLSDMADIEDCEVTRDISDRLSPSI